MCIDLFNDINICTDACLLMCINTYFYVYDFAMPSPRHIFIHIFIHVIHISIHMYIYMAACNMCAY